MNTQSIKPVKKTKGNIFLHILEGLKVLAAVMICSIIFYSVIILWALVLAFMSEHSQVPLDSLLVSMVNSIIWVWIGSWGVVIIVSIAKSFFKSKEKSK